MYVSIYAIPKIEFALEATDAARTLQAEVAYDEPWHRKRIKALAEKLHPPLNSELALASMLRLASKLEPYMDQYEILLMEGKGARLPSDVIGQMIDNRRLAQGQSAARRYIVDDDRPFAADETLSGSPLSKSGRALFLTEFIITGAGIRHGYDEVSKYLPSSRIDVATVGIHLPTARDNGGPEGWFHPDTRSFYNGNTWEVEKVLSSRNGVQFDAATIGTDTQLVVQGIESILHEARLRQRLPLATTAIQAAASQS